MWFSCIHIDSVRGFQEPVNIVLSKNINIFVGANNAGKSTIIGGILKIQDDSTSNIRSNANDSAGFYVLQYEDFNPLNMLVGGSLPIGFTAAQRNIVVEIKTNDELSLTTLSFNEHSGRDERIPIQKFEGVEPLNILYPYLSNRKTFNYMPQTTSNVTNSVANGLSNLYAKINRISSRYAKGHDEYHNACIDILGYPIEAIQTVDGVICGYKNNEDKFIPLTDMGEGVANLLGIIVNLCIAKNKIFVIEEIENDLHPRALKALLRLIEKASRVNQIFITTHSNIVVKYLGGINDAKLFEVRMKLDTKSQLPLSEVKEVPYNPEERRALLETLGYDFLDFGMWEGWLFFEESTAEQVVREAIIPLFFSELTGKIRTYGKGGRDGLQQRFDDFNHLFSFLHLEPTYKNRAWVIIDEGVEELAVLEKIKSIYVKHGWKESQFIQLKEHEFETYYPKRFRDSVNALPAKSDRKVRKEAKGKLAKEVVDWAIKHPEEAKDEFKESASEIIAIVASIAKVVAA